MAIDGLSATESGELWALSGLGLSLPRSVWGHSLRSPRAVPLAGGGSVLDAPQAVSGQEDGQWHSWERCMDRE